MTRASKTCLVLDGREVRLRLEAERLESATPVHVDWVRFTVSRRRSPAASADKLFPIWPDPMTNIWEPEYREGRINSILSLLPDCDFDASVQAFELAEVVAAAMGPDFTVALDVRKGYDFYRCRWSIERNATECGWVGFLASGDNKRQQAQAATLHVNLYGTACTFAASGWRDRLADIVEAREGTLTRCDLALDFFDGLAGGLDAIVTECGLGLCDVHGKAPKTNCVGDWLRGRERSFYIGSKEAGKQTNVYEKGHQLFGAESGSNWLRMELRYGNKLRVLPADMLRRPADFFAGASPWHEAQLSKACPVVSPESVRCDAKLPLQTVEAECYRALKWVKNTAAGSLSFAIEHCGVQELADLLGGANSPGRLRSFSASEKARGAASALGRFLAPGGRPSLGYELTGAMG